ncbi:type II secretion system protein [Candidatus Beckwithbacteria bacterium]|nr:type II secretion system protein [Candidatus Beckwithbacteria bacterium]
MNKNSGFTLVEMLVVIATFALIMGATVNVLASIVRNNAKAKTITNLKKEGGNAISIVQRKLQVASQITPDSACGDPVVSGTSLTFSILNENKEREAYVLECDEQDIVNDGDTDNTNIELTTPANMTTLVNPNFDFTLSNCSISCYKSSIDRYTVDFSFDLTAPTGEKDTFSTSVVLRNYQ